MDVSHRVTVVIGAATAPGRLHAAAIAVAERLRLEGADVSVLDLSAARIEVADGRPEDDYDDDTRAAIATLAEAEAVVVASPVYRASIPGVLKNLLDLVPVSALEAKPVGIVAMGGSAHHYLGVDRHLRDILSWFGALAAPTSVYLTGGDFDAGTPTAETVTALGELAETVLALADRLSGMTLGPEPLAKRAW